VLVWAGPAHAVTINDLVFEGPAFLGTGPDGPGTIDLIGQINLGLTTTFTQAAGSSFTSSMFLGVTGCTISDCTGAFQVNFDFAGLDKDWQIVKIAEHIGGPAQWAKGAWVTDTLQTGPLSDLQSGSVSLQEWLDYTASAKTVSGCSGPQPPSGCNHDLGNPIWHMLVFGVGAESPTSVPEPGTLLLLGLGVVAAGTAARKTSR